MSDNRYTTATSAVSPNRAAINAIQALREELDVVDHEDPDKHYIGTALPIPTNSMVLPIGAGNTAGVSPFPARADHEHAFAAGSWTGVSYQNSWADYGSGFQAVQYRKAGDMVYIRGLANPPTTPAGTVITNLPTAFRPPAQQIFICHAGEPHQFARVDIAANGDVSYISGPDGYVSFAQIFFSTLS